MVETKTQTVYMAVANGQYVGEFPTMEGALYAEAKVKVELALRSDVGFSDATVEDVLGFILNNRDIVRDWLDAYARHIVAPRPQRKPVSPQLHTPDMDEGRNGR